MKIKRINFKEEKVPKNIVLVVIEEKKVELVTI